MIMQKQALANQEWPIAAMRARNPVERRASILPMPHLPEGGRGARNSLDASAASRSAKVKSPERLRLQCRRRVSSPVPLRGERRDPRGDRRLGLLQRQPVHPRTPPRDGRPPDRPVHPEGVGRVHCDLPLAWQDHRDRDREPAPRLPRHEDRHPQRRGASRPSRPGGRLVEYHRVDVMRRQAHGGGVFPFVSLVPALIHDAGSGS